MWRNKPGALRLDVNEDPGGICWSACTRTLSYSYSSKSPILSASKALAAGIRCRLLDKPPEEGGAEGVVEARHRGGGSHGIWPPPLPPPRCRASTTPSRTLDRPEVCQATDNVFPNQGLEADNIGDFEE